MADKLPYPGYYELKSLFLIPTRAEGFEAPIDIGETVAELNIFESVLSNSLMGDIIIRDRFGLEDMIIHRNVFLFVEIETPGVSDRIRHLFYIYENEKHEADDRQIVSRLKFTTFEYIKNMKTLVSKSFANQDMSGDTWTIPGTITALLENEHPNGLGINGSETENLPSDIAPKRKTVSFDSAPDNTLSFVSPKWRPFRCIEYITQRAMSEEGSASYLFYETTAGYQFRNIHRGFIQATENAGDLRKYFYQPASLEGYEPGEDVEHKYSIIQDLHRKKEEEEIEDTLSGLRGSKMFNYDLLRRRYSESAHDPSTQIQQIGRTVDTGSSVNWQRGEKDTRENKATKSEYGIPPYIIRPTLLEDHWNVQEQKSFFEPYSTSFYVTDGRKLITTGEQEYERWLQLRFQFLKELELIEYQITAYGKVSFKAGDFVRLYLPSTRGHNGDNNTAENIIDERRSGVYIVTNIRHQFTQTNHFVHMDLARNSLSDKKFFPTED